jgi:hypothetical protein
LIALSAAHGGPTGGAPGTSHEAANNFMATENEDDGEDEDQDILQVDGTSSVSKFSI